MQTRLNSGPNLLTERNKANLSFDSANNEFFDFILKKKIKRKVSLNQSERKKFHFFLPLSDFKFFVTKTLFGRLGPGRQNVGHCNPSETF